MTLVLGDRSAARTSSSRPSLSRRPTHRISLVRRGLVVAAAGALLVGCTDLSSLNFTKDERLTFSAPHKRSTVSLPVTVDWTMSSFRTAAPDSEPRSADAGYFAVFLDRAPVRPGQAVVAVAADDAQCRLRPGCPDEKYLANRGVFTTTESAITLRTIRPISRTSKDHRVTVVLMDTSGHRIGESAWHVDFTLTREGTS
jgi:hypothetical protein